MKLERSRSDYRLFGLCGGIARSMGVDPFWLRAGLVVGSLFTGGMLLMAYVVGSMIVPKEPAYRADGHTWYVPTPSAYGFAAEGAGAAPAGFIAEHASSPLDTMAEKLEAQALVKELKDLRAKLARYEQQQ